MKTPPSQVWLMCYMATDDDRYVDIEDNDDDGHDKQTWKKCKRLHRQKFQPPKIASKTSILRHF